MTFFADQPPLLFPSRAGEDGLRRAQLGAVQALAAHFTHRREPALVVLPTGAGKTAVMTMIPFLLPPTELQRVLVLTPSQIIRRQVVNEFSRLTRLRQLKLLPDDTTLPSVLELTSNRKTPEDWEELHEYDVVVSTQLPVSPKEDHVCPPPADLFQLIVIDEAHHASADTWAKAIDAFPDAYKVLLTATPYRRDGRELKAELIYAYPLRQAIQDGIYKPITYMRVDAEPGEEAERLCAAAALLKNPDRNQSPRFVIRTHRVKDAKALVDLYAKHGLKVEVIYADKANQLERIVTDVRSPTGTLDGIVAVGMLGEGFDLPELKVAVVHESHKSLASVLQFIGRISREAPEQYGAPRVLAVPRVVNKLTQELFEEDPDWAEVIPNLADSAVGEEQSRRRFVKRFVRKDGTRDRISLYGLHPYLSATVYEAGDVINFSAKINLRGITILTHDLLADDQMVVVVTGGSDEPKWAGYGDLVFSEYDLHIYYYDAESQLLVEHTTNDEQAKKIRSAFAGSACSTVSKGRLSGLLGTDDNVVYVQIGLGRAGALGSGVADYTAFSSSQDLKRAVHATDARVSTPNHVFARVDGRYIGFSAAGKVYSNRRVSLEQFLEWAKEVVYIVQHKDEVLKLPGLPTDFQTLPVKQIPAEPLAVELDARVFYRSGTLFRPDSTSVDLLDLEITVSRINEHEIHIVWRDGFGQEICQMHYDCQQKNPMVFTESASLYHINLESTGNGTGEDLSLPVFLEKYPLTFYLADGSTIIGKDLKPLPDGFPDIPEECYVNESGDWADCEVLKEFWEPSDDRTLYADSLSVQEVAVRHAKATLGDPWILIDHGAGEIADVIAIGRVGTRQHMIFFHCKAAKSPKGQGKTVRPKMGRRTSDLYEVVNQALKGVRWVKHPLLIEEFKRRVGSRMHEIDGRDDEFRDWIDTQKVMGFDYEIVIVQPALNVYGRSSNEPDACTRLLLAAHNWIYQLDTQFRVMAWNRPDNLALWTASPDD